MGTEVLRSQDLFAERFRVPPPSFQRRRSLTNLVVNRKPSNNVGGYHKKTSPRPEKKKPNAVPEGKKPSPAVDGHVTLLKRGESLGSLASKLKSVDDLGIGRIGPDSPEITLKQVRLQRPVDEYAGSAFSLSPSPRSLPLPSFFKKLHDDGKMKPFDDSATRDLRRLLRLDYNTEKSSLYEL